MFSLQKRSRSSVRSNRSSYRPQIESLEGRLVLSGTKTALAASALQALLPGQVQPLAAKIYTVAAVNSFTQTAGNFASSNLARVRGLQLYLTSGGRVANVVIPNTFFGTVSGQLSSVKGQQNLYQFSATKTVTTMGGLTASYVQVQISTDRSGHPLQMAIVSRSGNNLAAVVNNSSFGSSVSNGYKAKVTLR